MIKKGNHLVFYDGKCGLCDKFVQFLLKKDEHKIFVFAPLQGKNAEVFLNNLSKEIVNADSVILIENYKTSKSVVFIYGKAAFRILWLMGGFWGVLGLLNFIPSIFYDWGYRLVARNRKRFFSEDSCVIPSKNNQNRFLD